MPLLYYFNNDVNYLVDACFIACYYSICANLISGLIKMAKILKVRINF
jgi:hypothetical protein